ncbi:YcjF family protein [Lignipirellula cremea]|uniref:tRNA modification GTPase TrmE n=1 Tax=Lignipirellula cremea TaxID=2528010 RepID=A0A518E0I3_9BACT|nr:DUF697 domain-containing protein [Lignipirellula cremea]QDU97589.1 tRNA modification GTPase TrmE [Lignipirellula cremea]
MNPKRTTTGLLVLFVLACMGVMLVYLPTLIVKQIEIVKELGDVWLYVYLAVVGTGAALLVFASGYTLWTLWGRSRVKEKRREDRIKNPSQLTREEKQKEVDENLAAIEDLQTDSHLDPQIEEQLEPLVKRFEAKRESQQLEIVAFGSISSGKSSLLNALAGRDVFQTDLKGGTTVRRAETPWPGIDKVVLVDTPGLGEIEGAENISRAARAATDADLVLLVVDGPLRESEFELLARLGNMEKRILICLNKTDWYDARNRDRLLGQIVSQVKGIADPENVLAVRSQPSERLRVRVLADGSEVEEMVPTPPDIGPLAARMMKVVKRDGSDLLMANLLLQSRGLVDEARTRVKESLDRRAWGIVDKYMWGAGGAAAISPFPLVDLMAGCAISTKMVVDLAQVYRQDIDLQAAVNLVGQLGKNLIAILGVSAATPALAALVGSSLKAVPGIGTLAGGLLQGVVQAVVTRWIGAVFIAYFREEMKPPEGLAELARRQWAMVTSVTELRKVVETARQKLFD